MNWNRTGKWLTTVAAALTLAACGNGGNEEETSDTDTASGDFDASQSIAVISREDGSGTRDAFTEITAVYDEDSEIDNTTAEAGIQNSTGAVLSTVAGDPVAIGYVSTGSLDDSVKTVNIDGFEPTAESIQAEEYPIYRRFNVAYGEELSAEAQDFWNFVLSPEAQAIVEEEGYIAISEDEQEEYTADESVSGDVTISGSTSVEPAMQAIADAYQAENPDVTINIQANGSGAGMEDAMTGANDIGMASRALDEEEAAALTSQPMALDGIAIIVHQDNPVEDLTVEQVQQIYTGEVTTWDEVSA